MTRKTCANHGGEKRKFSLDHASIRDLNSLQHFYETSFGEKVSMSLIVRQAIRSLAGRLLETR